MLLFFPGFAGSISFFFQGFPRAGGFIFEGAQLLLMFLPQQVQGISHDPDLLELLQVFGFDGNRSMQSIEFLGFGFEAIGQTVDDIAKVELQVRQTAHDIVGGVSGGNFEQLLVFLFLGFFLLRRDLIFLLLLTLQNTLEFLENLVFGVGCLSHGIWRLEVRFWIGVGAIHRYHPRPIWEIFRCCILFQGLNLWMLRR